MAAVQTDVGRATNELDTPALLVDLNVMDENIARIADTCRRAGVNWRPHIKAHKIPAIAKRQVASGAVGVTCAKLGEAEVMASAGIRDILIANQVVGATKIERLIALQSRADVIVAVDNAVNVTALNTAACANGVTLPVVVEVDVGLHRAGTSPGRPAVELAQLVHRCAGLRLAGVMAWEGHTAPISNLDAKQVAVAAAVRQLTSTAEDCRAAGLPMDIVSCGGTGTYAITAYQPGVTEIQAGGGIFGDVLYRRSFHVSHPYALTLLTTVCSRPTTTRIICDAGKKAMSGEAATPEPIGLGAVRSIRLSAEHTTIELESSSDEPAVGDLLEFVVGYSDTTVHLHEELYGVRNGKVEVVWPVLGRAKFR